MQKSLQMPQKTTSLKRYFKKRRQRKKTTVLGKTLGNNYRLRARRNSFMPKVDVPGPRFSTPRRRSDSSLPSASLLLFLSASPELLYRPACRSHQGPVVRNGRLAAPQPMLAPAIFFASCSKSQMIFRMTIFYVY